LPGSYEIPLGPEAGAMHGELKPEPWDQVVVEAAPSDHSVQLYQDQDSRRRGQLTVVDADEFLPRFMRDAMPDSPLFLGLAADVIGEAHADGRYQRVRWWGEMVNVLWERGDAAASMQLEDLFDQLAHEHDIAIFCSFLMDNFDGDLHAHMLPRLGTNHSHLIPVEDYARLERAVADALTDAVGRDEAVVLERRLARYQRDHREGASRPRDAENAGRLTRRSGQGRGGARRAACRARVTPTYRRHHRAIDRVHVRA
jgi:hypothetical protein